MVNRIGDFVLIFLLFFTFSLRGEGTAQILSSDAGHGKLQIMESFSDFGLYDRDPEYRLHVRVANVGEVIYYGFGDRLNNNDQTISNVYYRITDPNGTVVVPETLLTSSGAGYIDTYSKAVAGPLQVVGSGGYNAKSLVAAWQGDYYFEFRYTGFGVDRCKFKYFDITVATPTNVAIPGRVWSQGWQFTADNMNFSFQGKLYVYSDDGIVTSIKFNNMQPFVFTVFCNQNGTDPNETNWLINRKSKSGKYYAPQYKIFLNNPNNDLTNPTYTFPTGALGEIIAPILLESNCNGTGVFTVNVTKPGKVILHLDIDPTPGTQPTDVEIPWNVVSGTPNNIPWNGLNGLGQPVVNGTSIPVSVTYINGLTNLPIYDVEASPNGFIVELIRPKPTGTPDPPVDWDDTDIWGGGQSPTGGCNYILPNGCHTWTSTVGESNTVNTWWYTASSSMVAAEPFIMKRVPQPLGNITGAESAFCAGSAGKTFSVTPDPNSTTYTWSYTGGDYVVNGTGPAVTIDFGASSVSGNLTVVGNNISCGAGATPSPAFPITIVPGPVVSVTPDAIEVCSDEPSFALTGGSPSGGVYTEGGIPLTTFDPQTATPGVHTITYTYSTPPPTVCTGSSTLSITVNPAPVVALSTFQDVCINAAPFILSNGTPAGGTYSGDGVAAGSFSPAAAGVGTHLITYQYTTPEGCSNDATGPILVLPLPAAAGAILPVTPEICQGSTQLYSTAVIADAADYQWSVTPTAAASDISIDPASHNLATITWDAAYTGNAMIHVMGQNGCGDGTEASQTLTIRPNPVVTAKTCDNIVTTTEGRLIRMNWGLPLGGSYAGDGISISDGVTFDPKNAGGAGIKTITYTVTNQFLCSASTDVSIQIFDPPPFVQCGTSTILDVRTNTSYKTFLSGSGASAKCWMARNLDIGTMITEGTPQTNNCVAEKYCWLADAAQCTANGALFQWDELIHYEDPAHGYQDLCMPGWHVATAAEWQSLIDATQGPGQAGGYLKDVTPTGFDLLLRGVLYLNYLWAYIPTETITGSLLWTSTRSGEKAITRGFNIMNPSVSLYESSRTNAFPVRCVKDN